MNGFLEITSAVLRMGPNARAYGDKFELSAMIAGDGRKATVKALVSPDKLFSRAYMHDAFRILRAANWKSAYYEHDGDQFTVDLTSEPFIIRKEHPMSVQHAHDDATHALDALTAVATGDVAAKASVLLSVHQAKLQDALGSDLHAQADAGAAVGHAAADLAAAGMAVSDAPHKLIGEALEKVAKVGLAVHEQNLHQMKSHPHMQA